MPLVSPPQAIVVLGFTDPARAKSATPSRRQQQLVTPPTQRVLVVYYTANIAQHPIILHLVGPVSSGVSTGIFCYDHSGPADPAHSLAHRIGRGEPHPARLVLSPTNNAL